MRILSGVCAKTEPAATAHAAAKASLAMIDRCMGRLLLLARPHGRQVAAGRFASSLTASRVQARCRPGLLLTQSTPSGLLRKWIDLAKTWMKPANRLGFCDR